MSEAVKTLVDLVSHLDAEDQATLVAFAEFLVERQSKAALTMQGDTAAITRQRFAKIATATSASTHTVKQDRLARKPDADVAAVTPSLETESLVAAIKRLMADHPNIEPGELLGDTATLMERFVAGGCTKEEAIMDLEALFARCVSRAAGRV